MNTTVFTTYLQRSQYDFTGELWNPPDGILKALRCSVFATNITFITYSFHLHGGFSGLLQQLSAFRTIIQRQTNLDVFLHLELLDNHALTHRMLPDDREITLEEWRATFCSFIEDIAKQAVKTLHVSGGGHFISALAGTLGDANGGSETLSVALVPNLGPRKTSQIFTNIHPPMLETFELVSDMLLSPTFYQSTIKFLKASAPRLITLKIEIREDFASCADLLSTLRLPQLKELQLAPYALIVDPILKISFDDIIQFALRCMKLEELFVRGIEPKPPSPDFFRGAHLPKLTKFTGHPVYAAWLLQLPHGTVPRLEHVSAIAERYVLDNFDFALLDPIVDLISKETRALIFGFTFKCQAGLEEWIKNVASRKGILVGSGLHTLELCFSWYIKHTREKMEALAGFINASPSVTNVNLDEFTLDPELREEGRWDNYVAAEFFKGGRIPRVKSLTINKVTLVDLAGELVAPQGGGGGGGGGAEPGPVLK
ncbi:hypothetical protein BKA70DRAFT_1395491 [Coprinopsis sp. MPI-PUGE-AT-0042]|nr:hypothetical protein BKA70DRAFT_1395491 [Coprinopsis sp. MPI-PUGE-AT-0042]